MTLATPGLIADTTPTDGVSTYTLTGVTSGGYRSLADAVAAGHAANGQTVYYSVRDTTTSGGSLNFEIGIGTIGGDGSWLARTTIIESSNGDAAVDWVLGGSRQVLIAIGAQGLAILTAANAFSGNNTFSGTSVFNGTASFTQSPTVLTTGAGLLTLASDQSTGNPFQLRMGGRNGSGATVYYGFIRPRITNATAGNEGSRLEMLVYSAGALTEVLRVNADGSLDNVVAGTKFDNFASGTTAPFYQATAPIGWDRVTTGIDGCAVRLVTAGSPGTATTAGRSNVGTATVTIGSAQMPPHNHQTLGGAFSGFIRSWVSGDPGPNNWLTTAADPDKGTAVYVADVATASSGSGSALSLSLRVADFLLATKAA